MIQRIIAFILLLLSIPFLVILFILVKLTSNDPFFFTQKRLGKNKIPFVIYKIRTMILTAETDKHKYAHLNESDGPAFKIYNDPRYTKIGKILSRTGLDEVPQLINIVKGEMSFIGPRPLPVEEATKVPLKYVHRFSVLPGITSLWVIKGSHKLSFTTWMELDLEYIHSKSLLTDLVILFGTIKIIGLSMLQFLKDELNPVRKNPKS